MGTVAVQHEAFDCHVGNLIAAEKRKEGRDGGVALEPEVFPQRAVELEAVAASRDQRAFSYVRAPLCGLRVRRQTPSPRPNPRASTSVIS